MSRGRRRRALGGCILGREGAEEVVLEVRRRPMMMVKLMPEGSARDIPSAARMLWMSGWGSAMMLRPQAGWLLGADRLM